MVSPYFILMLKDIYKIDKIDSSLQILTATELIFFKEVANTIVVYLSNFNLVDFYSMFNSFMEYCRNILKFFLPMFNFI